MTNPTGRDITDTVKRRADLPNPIEWGGRTPPRPRTNPECTAPVHGTWRARDRDCTCREALTAVAKKVKRSRAGVAQSSPDMVPIAGSMRRVRALALRGISCANIAHVLGYDPKVVHRVMRPRYPTITAVNAQRIRIATDTFVAVMAVVGEPADPWADRQRRYAAENDDWHPLDAWADIDDPDDLPDAHYCGPRMSIADQDAKRQRSRVKIPTMTPDDWSTLFDHGSSLDSLARDWGTSRRAVELAYGRTLGAASAAAANPPRDIGSARSAGDTADVGNGSSVDDGTAAGAGSADPSMVA